ncbi:MAG: YdcF family protein [Acidiferrobacterales bacterium]
MPSIRELAEFLFVPLFYVFVVLIAMTVAAFRRGAGGLRRWRFVLAAAAVATYVVSTPLLPNLLLRHLEDAYKPPSLAGAVHGKNLIMILSGGWLRVTRHGWYPELGEDGWESTYAGVQLWHRIGGIILFSGAPTPDNADSGAAEMARVAMRMGVPAADIRIEPDSLDTHQNIQFSRRRIRQFQGSAWLVTTAYHMMRSIAVARRLGLRMIPYPCFYRSDERVTAYSWMPSNNAPVILEVVLHEWVGYWYYRLRGWA